VSRERTKAGRGDRRPFVGFAGVKCDADDLQAVDELVKSLNVDRSDLLRAFLGCVAGLWRKSRKFSGEIKSSEKVNPPTASDKIRYV
jgi:hypothetical protein